MAFGTGARAFLTGARPSCEGGVSAPAADRSETFEALGRLADLVATAPEMHVLLEAALDAALGPLGLRRGAIYVRAAGSSDLVLEVGRGLPPQAERRHGRKPIAAKGTGLAGRSAFSGRPTIVANLAKAPEAADLRAAFREAGVEVASAAAVPVVIEGRSIAVVLVISEVPRPFDPTEVAYLRLVGALLGATLVAQRALRDHAKTNKELQALTTALEQRTAEMKELDKYKTQLIHVITHELRKPLAPIFTYSDMLLGMNFPPEKQKQFLERMRAAANEMNQYITQMIDAAKLEQGGVQILYSDVDVVEVVKMAAASLNTEADAARIRVDIVPELSRRKFTTDGVKIGEIVGDLIENAIKYIPDGGHVEVRLREAGGTLDIAVKDTGIGIPAEDLPHLFTKFYTVTKADLPRPAHRAGLGLYLAKVYADALGATLSVHSTLGKGSTFTLRIPVAS